MGTYCPTGVSMEEFIPVLTLQGPGCAYMMYSLSREYIAPPFKLGHNNDVPCSAHEDLMASFHHLSKETRSLKQLTNALRIFNHNLCLVWSWIFVQERELGSRANHDKYALFANLYNYPVSSSRTKPDTANICRMD